MVSVVCTLCIRSGWDRNVVISFVVQCRNTTAIREAKLGAQHPLNVLEVGGNNVRYIKSGTGLVLFRLRTIGRAAPI